MSDEKKKKGLLSSLGELSFIKKLKSIKHIEIIIVVIFILIMLLICFGGKGNFSFLNLNQETSLGNENISLTYTRTSEYQQKLENKIKTLLSSMENVGNVEVMVSLKSSVELEFATDQTITTNAGNTTTQNKVILVQSNGVSAPIVINEKLPEINSVVIVSSGAKNISTKLNIIDAVQTLLDIDSDKIQVFVGK